MRATQKEQIKTHVTESRSVTRIIYSIIAIHLATYMYRKSYERECISWFMGTSDVLKVLKIARAVGECNLRTFKTSRVTINHEMHEQVHMIFYLLYSQICVQIWRSVLHSITSIALYNLFMHSSLTNQKRDILLSI